MRREARYDQIADFYDGTVGDDVGDPVASAVFDLLGDVGGLRVLDLACGQGRVSRELARRGSSVVGVDIAVRLLELARGFEEREPLGIEYVEADATEPDALAATSVDAVVCHFGLSDIDDLDGVLSTVARVLRPGGRFVFSIVHPCFPGWGERTPSSWRPRSGYHVEGWWLADSPGFRGRVGANHRMLSTYLNALVERGLRIEAVAEPEPGPEWLERNPGGAAVPVYLVVRCRRSG